MLPPVCPLLVLLDISGKKLLNLPQISLVGRTGTRLPVCKEQKISWNALLVMKKSILCLKLHGEMGMWKGGM